MKGTFPLDHVHIGSDAGNNNIYFIYEAILASFFFDLN